MTFEELRENGVAGETWLHGKGKYKFLFFGFNSLTPELVIFLDEIGNVYNYREDGIRNWTIKQSKPERLYLWAYKHFDYSAKGDWRLDCSMRTAASAIAQGECRQIKCDPETNEIYIEAGVPNE